MVRKNISVNYTYIFQGHTSQNRLDFLVLIRSVGISRYIFRTTGYLYNAKTENCAKYTVNGVFIACFDL